MADFSIKILDLQDELLALALTCIDCGIALNTESIILSPQLFESLTPHQQLDRLQKRISNATVPISAPPAPSRAPCSKKRIMPFGRAFSEGFLRVLTDRCNNGPHPWNHCPNSGGYSDRRGYGRHSKCRFGVKYEEESHFRSA